MPTQPPTRAKPVALITALTALAAATAAFYFLSNRPAPSPVTDAQRNEDALRTAAYKVVRAVKAGKSPTKGSELEPLAPDDQSGPNDAFGRELIIEVTAPAGPEQKMTVRSLGQDGLPGTDDDMRAEATITHETAPGYDEHLLGPVTIITGK